MPRYKNWSQPRRDALFHMWVMEGRTMSFIGEVLGTTRSAIAGQIHRTALTGKKGTGKDNVVVEVVYAPPLPKLRKPVIKLDYLCNERGCVNTRLRPYLDCQEHHMQKVPGNSRANESEGLASGGFRGARVRT